jgi:four helix bundle protein
MRRFEEIEAWQISRELAKQIYEATKQGRFAHDYGLRDQIERAAVSIMTYLNLRFRRD